MDRENTKDEAERKEAVGNPEEPENESVSDSETTGKETFAKPEDIEKETFAEPEDIEEEPFAEPEAAESEAERKKLHIILPLIAASIVAVYLIICAFYMKHYLPNTVVNGVDCSSKTVEELEALIVDEVNGYELTLVERGGETETISDFQIDLQVVFDGALEEILENQRTFAWPLALFSDSSYEPGNTASYDEELMATVLAELNCADVDQMTVTQDAEIMYDEDAETYEIEPAVYGTYLDTDMLYDLVDNAVISLEETVDLEAAGCYEDPVYTEESEEVVTACSEMIAPISANITYYMLDIGTFEISKKEMSSWVVLGDNFEVSVDEEVVAAYVAAFAEKYDTQYTSHTLKTTWGSTVTVSSGSYGWKLDQEAETEALLEEIAAGEDVTREPYYSHSAASHGANDYGSTYVEINLTAQHLYFYKNGVLIVESDFVSGNVANGNATPTGIYPVTYTQKDAVLRGDDYESPVSYWMPFNGGVGMHDATWRSSFGGTIYKTNGSHGCINLPLSAAKTIFENIKAGDAVIVYTLPGTESVSQASSSSSSDSDSDTDSDEGTDEDSDSDTGTDSGSSEQ